ncbi:hypothetical protein ACU4GD_19670 [Cupriavidus basilensis]
MAEQCEGLLIPPQGVLTHLYRAIAGGRPARDDSRSALHTFIDPRTAQDSRYHGGATSTEARQAIAEGRANWGRGDRFPRRRIPVLPELSDPSAR